MTKLDSPAEADIVADDRGGTDGKRFRIGDVELVELDLALPNLPQEILEDLDRQLLAGAAAIAEAERREARIVANRQRLAVDDAIDGAEAAIVDRGLAAVLSRRTLFARSGHLAKPICSHLASSIWWLVGAVL